MFFLCSSRHTKLSIVIIIVLFSHCHYDIASHLPSALTIVTVMVDGALEYQVLHPHQSCVAILHATLARQTEI